MCLKPKVPYFFFSARKFMAHSFIQNPKSCCFFFFPAKREKKIHFFPKKSSWAIHSILGRVSLFLLKIGLYFFFPHFWVFFLYFFFPTKVHLPFIHSISRLFFFFRRRKKKNSFFIHPIDFFQKCGENELSQGKKKYGTFGLGVIFS